MNSELEEQMKMLEGLDSEVPEVQPIQPNFMPPVGVETAETLRGEMPFIPATPENPTNLGVVTNQVQPNAFVNQQAQAQVVQQTTTNFTQPASQPAVDMNAAPTFVNIGDNSFQTKTDFLKLKENEVTRVALANYNAVSTHFHYENGLGYFKCLSDYPIGSDWPELKAICCMQPNPYDPSKLVGHGKTKVFLPVVEYPVNHVDGRSVVPNTQPKLKVLALTKQEYDTLADVQANYGLDTSVFDLSITRKKDTSGYLKYTLTPVPSMRNQFGPAIEAEFAKITNETYNLAKEEFAKTLTVERVAKFYQQKAEQERMAQQFSSPMQNMGVNLNM